MAATSRRLRRRAYPLDLRFARVPPGRAQFRAAPWRLAGRLAGSAPIPVLNHTCTEARIGWSDRAANGFCPALAAWPGRYKPEKYII